ncbi:MAG: TonB-dependent receptor plug domain-containing protein, partial [Treponema sp.]|nr:TonB-dependent receptor plug domain-containing protein [Treponema sp.]
VVVPGGDSYTLSLRLTGIMEGRELVVEAARPESGETQTGRSIALSGRDIAQAAEIGIIEDVMSSVKLLPGVGYAGFFDAQPSIRGGDPGDMRASLDGFYVFNPYHWGGGFSIFDPRMVESAQLSHGVFTSRYGHSISGLLDIATKKPSPIETQFEMGINTSAVNANLSLPLAGKGGILFLGRVTYHDPFIWIAQQLVKNIDFEELQAADSIIEALQALNSITTAPYIRSATVTGNYRFFDNLEFKGTGFWGMDGVGMNYENSSRSDKLNSDSIMDYYWAHYQGFISGALLWNPRSDMLLKSAIGTGYEKTIMDGDTRYNIFDKKLTDDFTAAWYYPMLSARVDDPYDFRTTLQDKQTDLVVNAQGRLDYDWDAGKGFLLASGVQEMFTRYETRGNRMTNMEKNLRDFTDAEQIDILKDMGFEPDSISEELQRILIVSIPQNYNPNAQNNLFTTSVYSLAEYHTPSNRFKTEFGLRLDHYYLIGDGFSVQSKPALNPRLNVDFNVFKNIGYVQSFDISAGTGFFSSMNNNVFTAVEKYNITEIKPNRSWTSVLGTKLELFNGIVFNIEGYYKYAFDRMYTPVNIGLDGKPDVKPHFNGEGKAWGIDLLLQKTQSRYWDGWVSYSFNWVKYRDPDAGNADMGLSGGENGNDWYFPSYHRFHNFNLVLNIKPVSKMSIYNRLSFASGIQINRRIGDHPISYPVYVLEDRKFIELFYWPAVRDENNRTTPSILWDIKVSIFGNSRNGKVIYEMYNGIENVLGLLYSAQGNASFNQYTGEIDTGGMFAAYEIPIPRPSFGFKFSY